MSGFFSRKPVLGIEITSSAVRLAVLSGSGGNLAVFSRKSLDLPAGLVNESYAEPNITDTEVLGRMLREAVGAAAAGLPLRRAALSLPDSVFRVQSIPFDELPRKSGDQERLIRWRLEKSAFDISDTVLRYQVVERKQDGITVLACVAKQAVLSQYEALLDGLGLEPWRVGLSSFHTLNFYSASLAKTSPVVALARVSAGSFATVIADAGGARFYRFKEIKRGNADEITSRLLREIGDSIHFYQHLDPSRRTEPERLYLAGNSAALHDLATGLGAVTSLPVEILSPTMVLPSLTGADPELAAALGAGVSI